MYAAENPKFSAEIAGKQSFFCFGKYFSELVKKQFGQAWCETWGSVALVLCCPCTNVNQGRYRTKSVWRLCTPSACKFPVIFHKNAREYIQYSLRFLFHLTKNLTTHLSHNLCAVLPLDFFQKRSPLHPAFFDKKYRTPCTEYGICMQQQKAGITAALIPESVCPPASPVLPAVS